MTPDALRDVFVTVVQTRQCDLCTASLISEAVALGETVMCPACARVHGAGRRTIHVVWRPEASRLVAEDPRECGPSVTRQGTLFPPESVGPTWRAGDSCPTCHRGHLVRPNPTGPGVINASPRLLVCDRSGCGTSRLTTQPR